MFGPKSAVIALLPPEAPLIKKTARPISISRCVAEEVMLTASATTHDSQGSSFLNTYASNLWGLPFMTSALEGGRVVMEKQTKVTEVA